MNYILLWCNATLKRWELSRNVCVAVKLLSCTPVFCLQVCPPHSSTQGDMCLRTWDKFYKRRINVRIHGDGDTCLGVMWCFFFFLFFSTRTGASIISKLWRYVLYVKCHAAHAWNPSSPLPTAYFCSLCFACEAFCLYKLNSNYTTAWQSTKFVHLREAWHFGMAVNT